MINKFINNQLTKQMKDRIKQIRTKLNHQLRLFKIRRQVLVLQRKRKVSSIKYPVFSIVKLSSRAKSRTRGEVEGSVAGKLSRFLDFLPGRSARNDTTWLHTKYQTLNTKYLRRPLALSLAFLLILTLVVIIPSKNTQRAHAAWYNSSWSYRQKIIIDHNKVPNTDQTDFPVLIKITDATNPVFSKAQDDGEDILFTSSNETTKLSHEIETFSAATPALWAWVKIPTLSSSTDTVIYLYYGNAAATDQQNTTDVWSNGYVGVWHMNDNAASTAVSESTSYPNSGTAQVNTSTKTTTGKNGSALTFNGTSDYISIANHASLKPSLPLTISAWVNPGAGAPYGLVFSSDANNSSKYAGYWFNGRATTGFSANFGDNNGNNRRSKDAATAISADSWSYGTGIIRGATDMDVYFNGTNDNGTYSGTGGAMAYSTSESRIGLGQLYPGQNWYFTGKIDEVRVSSGERSADWIATEYNNQNSPETFYNISSEVEKDNYTVPSMPAGWYEGAWSKRQPITFESDLVPNTDQTDFPALVKLTDAGNELWANAQADGDDILFATTTGNKLAHEIEKYDNATNELWAWVKIPTLATASDTTIYMYYGNSSSASQQSATSVWSNGYVGVWHLGASGASLNTNDSTANTNNGTNNGATLTSGSIGSAASFSNTGIRIPDDTTLNPGTGPQTIQAWIYNNNWDVVGGDTNRIIYRKDNYGGGSGTRNFIELDVDKNTHLQNQGVFYGGWRGNFSSNTSLNLSQWYQVTTVRDVDTASIYAYLNGQQDGNTNELTPISNITNNADAEIGQARYYDTSNFNGKIDEVRISSTARSADWIATEYNNQNSPATFETFGTAEAGDSDAPNNPSAITALYSEGGTPITNNAGSDGTPYYSWPEAEAAGGATDQTGAYISGVAGYYSYFGTSCGAGGADPAASRGVLSDTGSGLHYSSDTNISVPDLTTNEDDYCFRIKTKDVAGNISTVFEAATYAYDTTAPNAPTFVASNPAGYSSTDSFDFTWPVATDNGVSGLQGYQYKTAAVGADWTLVGTNSVSAIESYQTGENIFIVRAYDNAGNGSSQVQTTYYYSNTAPTKPTSLTSTPDMFSDTNSFSFSWTAPVHDRPIVSYGYSINAAPTTSNLTWTGTTATTLAADSYATVQGNNTIYLVAKDDSGAYALSSANVASLVFNTQTTAPPIPLNPTISDSSNRAYSTYSLTIKWSAGTGQDANSFDHYLVQRSLDGTTFTDLATTTSTAYIDVSGLSNTTTYYYRIKAVDNADSTSAASTIVSRIPTGKYTSAPTIVSGPSDSNVKATSATITWVTNRASTGAVRFGTSEADLARSQIDPTEETEHSITIPGLEGNTKYYYQVQSLDNDRDYTSESAYSATASFTTLSLPAISDVKISNITLNTADLSWTTSVASNATLSYGKTISYGSSWSDTTSFTTNRTYKLTDLDHTSSYHFKITGTDEDGNSLISDDYVFDTLPMPKISSVNFETDLTGTEPKSYITWTTNVATTSSVDYTPKNGTETYEESQASFVISHKVELSKLTDDTSYSFYVSGSDQFGNKVTSDEFSFATPFDSRAAIISDVLIETSNVGLSKQDKAQIVVSWQTDEPTTSQVEYSEGLSGKDYTQRTSEDHNLSSNHLVIITDLTPNTPYHLRVVSKDKGGNLSSSPDQSIIAGDVPKSILNIIMETFENMFGWMGKLI